MSKETLEVLRGLSQAMGYAYDGALDEDGERIKIGLKRDEKNVKFLKERYKKATGKALSLKADGEAEILLQYMNRKRSWIQATKCYTIGGLKGVDEPERPAYDITRDFLKAAKYGK